MVPTGRGCEPCETFAQLIRKQEVNLKVFGIGRIMVRKNYNRALKQQFRRPCLISSDDIVGILETSDKDPKFHEVCDVIRILASTRIRKSQLLAFRISDVDIIGSWVGT